MNANVLRYLYNYHFSENQRIWYGFIPSLFYQQFTQQFEYSHGSIRDQLIHLINVDEIWFSQLEGIEILDQYQPSEFDDRLDIRTDWDQVEQMMHKYLQILRDEMLADKSIEFEEDKDLTVWQVLLHVINHGTDHRAQILRSLHDLGLETPPRTSSSMYMTTPNKIYPKISNEVKLIS